MTAANCRYHGSKPGTYRGRLDSTTRDLALDNAATSLGVAPDWTTAKIVAMASTLTFLSGYNIFILGIALLEAKRPLIQLSCDGAVIAVHYNSRSIAPLPLTAASAEPYYRAYRRLAEMIRDPRFALRFMLRAGDLVVFDNHRILHGRTAFESARHPRHLQGCYLTRDSVRSRAALLAAQSGGIA